MHFPSVLTITKWNCSVMHLNIIQPLTFVAWLTTRVQAKLTLADLSTIREHAVQHIEVHTGKVGGMFRQYRYILYIAVF